MTGSEVNDLAMEQGGVDLKSGSSRLEAGGQKCQTLERGNAAQPSQRSKSVEKVSN